MKQLKVRFFFTVFLYIVFLAILYKILIPFGDEPDFNVRTDRIINSIYGELIDISNLDSESICLNEIGIDRKFIIQKINFYCISENIHKKFIPRLFYALFFNLFVFISLYLISIKNEKINDVLKIYILSIIFPFNFYILGLLSEEIVPYLISILIFCSNFIWYRVALLILLFILDYDGQFPLVALFLSINYFSRFNFYERNIKYILVSVIVLANFNSSLMIDILNYITPSIYQDKINSILIANEAARDEYSIFTRVIICLISFGFMTANGIKVYLVYLYSIVRINSLFHLIAKIRFELYNIFILLFLFIGLFPTHSYGKYYIFFVPYLISKIFKLYDFQFLFKEMLRLNYLTLINISIYYLI